MNTSQNNNNKYNIHNIQHTNNIINHTSTVNNEHNQIKYHSPLSILLE